MEATIDSVIGSVLTEENLQKFIEYTNEHIKLLFGYGDHIKRIGYDPSNDIGKNTKDIFEKITYVDRDAGGDDISHYL